MKIEQAGRNIRRMVTELEDLDRAGDDVVGKFHSGLRMTGHCKLPVLPWAFKPSSTTRRGRNIVLRVI